MSRTHFWTILIGTDTTSFRARDKDTLVPTLKQLQRRHPEAVIKWFERGQLFESPLEAEQARAAAEREKRPKDWRPGGEHRDPRARYALSRDEKRQRFKRRAQRDRVDGPRTGPGGEGGAGRPRERATAGRPLSSRPWRPQGSGRPPRSKGPKTPREE